MLGNNEWKLEVSEQTEIKSWQNRGSPGHGTADLITVCESVLAGLTLPLKAQVCSLEVVLNLVLLLHVQAVTMALRVFVHLWLPHPFLSQVYLVTVSHASVTSQLYHYNVDLPLKALCNVALVRYAGARAQPLPEGKGTTKSIQGHFGGLCQSSSVIGNSTSGFMLPLRKKGSVLDMPMFGCGWRHHRTQVLATAKHKSRTPFFFLVGGSVNPLDCCSP